MAISTTPHSTCSASSSSSAGASRSCRATSPPSAAFRCRRGAGSAHKTSASATLASTCWLSPCLRGSGLGRCRSASLSVSGAGTRHSSILALQAGPWSLVERGRGDPVGHCCGQWVHRAYRRARRPLAAVRSSCFTRAPRKTILVASLGPCFPFLDLKRSPSTGSDSAVASCPSSSEI